METDVKVVNEETRTVELSFSSEKAVERLFGAEILSHDKDSVDLKRLKEVGVVLFSHGKDPNYGKMPIAKIDDVWLDVDERRVKATITFDDDELSDRVYQKVKKGFIKGVSFGYTVRDWEELASRERSTNKRFIGPAKIAMKWEPFEISIEPTPADPSVGIGRDIEDVNYVNDNLREQQELFWNLRRKLDSIL